MGFRSSGMHNSHLHLDLSQLEHGLLDRGGPVGKARENGREHVDGHALGELRERLAQGDEAQQGALARVGALAVGHELHERLRATANSEDLK